jgi:hypothetical protein
METVPNHLSPRPASTTVHVRMTRYVSILSIEPRKNGTGSKYFVRKLQHCIRLVRLSVPPFTSDVSIV